MTNSKDYPPVLNSWNIKGQTRERILSILKQLPKAELYYLYNRFYPDSTEKFKAEYNNMKKLCRSDILPFIAERYNIPINYFIAGRKGWMQFPTLQVQEFYNAASELSRPQQNKLQQIINCYLPYLEFNDNEVLGKRILRIYEYYTYPSIIPPEVSKYYNAPYDMRYRTKYGEIESYTGIYLDYCMTNIVTRTSFSSQTANASFDMSIIASVAFASGLPLSLFFDWQGARLYGSNAVADALTTQFMMIPEDSREIPYQCCISFSEEAPKGG